MSTLEILGRIEKSYCVNKQKDAHSRGALCSPPDAGREKPKLNTEG